MINGFRFRESKQGIDNIHEHGNIVKNSLDSLLGLKGIAIYTIH